MVGPRQTSLAQMPSVVIFMIAEYLTPREKITLSQLNKHFRELVNGNCGFWKNVTLVVFPRRLDQCNDIVRLVQQRNVTSLIFVSGSFKIQKAILKELPDLQRLSIPVQWRMDMYTLGMVRAYCKKLQKLEVRGLDLHSLWGDNIKKRKKPSTAFAVEKLVKNLDLLEELSLGGHEVS